MLQLDQLDNAELQDIRVACAYLFSPDLARDNTFLESLAPPAIEKTYREKSLRYDPELHEDESEALRHKRQLRLSKIEEAYRLLRAYVQNSPVALAQAASHRCKVVAVGGAKGGIGKSMLAANLSVLLSRFHKKVALVDLDLGGANLHLYMGGLQPHGTVHDYLANTVSDLQNVMTQTEFGPMLIGGNSAHLGAANIHFSKKLKLIRDLKLLDVDHVIIDLGGDTSYNNIDFFLAADKGVVLTTCDPASYLEAYNFIKVGVLRKFYRMFGPEFDWHLLRDAELANLIQEETKPGSITSFKSMDRILRRIEAQLPQHLPLVQAVLASFQFNLVVNQTASDSHSGDIVRRIQEVSRKMLSIQIDYAGSIGYHEELRQSAQKLIPALAEHPKGRFAEAVTSIARHLKLS